MTELITAVCVTRSQRAPLAAHAVASFYAQTYPADCLRMLVVYHAADPQPEKLAPLAADARTRVLRVTTGDWTSCYLAGLTQAAKAGGLVCFWDDDDTYHPGRLARQATFVTPTHAAVLTEALYYFYDSSEVFFFSSGGARLVAPACIPHTLLLPARDVPTKLTPAFTYSHNLGERIMLGVIRQRGIATVTRLRNEWWWARLGAWTDDPGSYDSKRRLVMEHGVHRRELEKLGARQLRALGTEYQWDDDFTITSPQGAVMRVSGVNKWATPLPAPANITSIHEHVT